MKGKKVSESSVIMAHVMMPQDSNPAGNVHGGVIMKHIDNAAAVVATRHSRSIIVTASIDRLDFFHPVYVGNLLTLKASLNLVGRSSMEVGVRIEAEDLLSEKISHIASAYLTFVALDNKSKPTEVAPLIIETDEEKRRNRQAASRRDLRLAEKKREEMCRKDNRTCDISD